MTQPVKRSGGQEFDAVGLSWETDTTPYDSGPVLVGAKLNHVGETAQAKAVSPWQRARSASPTTSLRSTTEVTSASGS
jgi:hypothetical protein